MKKGMMVFLGALFVFCGVSLGGGETYHDYAFSGRVYFNGAPAGGAKVYFTGYFECMNEIPGHQHWTVSKTFTANANGYFSGTIRQWGDFTNATLKAKYSGVWSHTIVVDSPAYNNPNIAIPISYNPPDEGDPCGNYPNCN
ncbi:MAG: hypothetical protein EHM45_24000 [Desulfobacteraceae bacterium]|nr:MAG: hypothetical protein EHM45_24000 [Desulfobacteraceae bacterium]